MEKDKKEISGLIKSLNRATRSIVFMTLLYSSIQKMGKLVVQALTSLILSSWIITLIIFIWTGDYLYLKISCTIPLIFAIGWLQHKINAVTSKLDGKSLNEKHFGELPKVKCLVLDEKDPNYNKEIELYSFYGKFNDNKGLSFYKPNEIKIINEESK